MSCGPLCYYAWVCIFVYVQLRVVCMEYILCVLWLINLIGFPRPSQYYVCILVGFVSDGAHDSSDRLYMYFPITLLVRLQYMVCMLDGG